MVHRAVEPITTNSAFPALPLSPSEFSSPFFKNVLLVDIQSTQVQYKNFHTLTHAPLSKPKVYFCYRCNNKRPFKCDLKIFRRNWLQRWGVEILILASGSVEEKMDRFLLKRTPGENIKTIVCSRSGINCFTTYPGPPFKIWAARFSWKAHVDRVERARPCTQTSRTS